MMPTPSITISSLLSRRESKVVVVVMLILIVWVLSGTFKSDDSSQGSQDNTTYVPEVQVKASIAEPFVRELKLSAVTENRRSVDVATQTSGIIDKIVGIEGAVIFQGEPIAILKPDARPEKIAQAEAELKQRKLEYNAAKKLAKSGLRAETALAESYFMMKQAEMHLKEAQLDESYRHITSPFTGILNEVYVHEGDVVKSLDTHIAQVLDVHPLLVVGYVPEKWRRKIEESAPAAVKIDKDELLYGNVNYISKKADMATRTFRVEVEIANPNGEIPSGMTAEISIPLENIKAHYVPSSALSLSDEGVLQIKYVDDQFKVHATAIEIAGEDENGLWVTGLPEHLNLITYGQAFVQAGDTASVSEQTR